jgi:hypothetical protein
MGQFKIGETSKYAYVRHISTSAFNTQSILCLNGVEGRQCEDAGDKAL